jgi:hypothetical protein
MKQFLTLVLLLIALQNNFAQCTTGNCTNGTGSYNYGWCVYSGEFKNGKPEGKGEMKYDDYTYSGQFKNGLEDGTGKIIKKDGTKENVQYAAGVKIISHLVKVEEKDYKPVGQDVNCISGNCITGYGTYQFSSGNKYTGNFKEYKREGQGTFYFANGEKFEGIFHNNLQTSGTYYYSIGATYTGTYDENGNEYNGTVTSSTGFKIPYINGHAIIPPPPKIVSNTNTTSGQSGTGVKPCCPICNCTGKTHTTIPGGAYTTDRYGNRTTVFGEYSSCISCGGTGHVN